MSARCPPSTQVRSLVSKVAHRNRIYYRALTDAEVPASGVHKMIQTFSEIDDDDYLLELVRGGDAILDDQRDANLPPTRWVTRLGYALGNS